MRFILICLLPGLLAGCYTRLNAGAGMGSVRSVPVGTTVSSARIQLSTDSRLAAVLVIGVMLADGVRYFRVGPDVTRTLLEGAPQPGPGDPGGATAPRVSVQDCKQPIDPQAGNLICR